MIQYEGGKGRTAAARRRAAKEKQSRPQWIKNELKKDSNAKKQKNQGFNITEEGKRDWDWHATSNGPLDWKKNPKQTLKPKTKKSKNMPKMHQYNNKSYGDWSNVYRSTPKDKKGNYKV